MLVISVLFMTFNSAAMSNVLPILCAEAAESVRFEMVPTSSSKDIVVSST